MKDNFLGKKMRNLRSINKVNEDNASGFHSNVVTTGFDRAVTGGNDSPLPVTMPKFKESIKKSKDILLMSLIRGLENKKQKSNFSLLFGWHSIK